MSGDQRRNLILKVAGQTWCCRRKIYLKGRGLFSGAAACRLERFVEREIVIKGLDLGSSSVLSARALLATEAPTFAPYSGKMFDLWLQPACTAACSLPSSAGVSSEAGWSKAGVVE